MQIICNFWVYNYTTLNNKGKTMKTLNQKIKTVTEDEPYVYLTSEELNALVKMRKVNYINVQADVKRHCQDKEHYYPGMFHSIALSKKDALNLAREISEWSEVKGEETLTKVYVSKNHTYNRQGDKVDGLYLSL